MGTKIELVAFDMDGTLVDVDSSWGEVHRFFGDSNAPALKLFIEDQIDDWEFIRRDVRLWQTHEPKIDIARITEILSHVPVVPGARELFDDLRTRGVRTAIVSGGIDILAERLAEEFQIDYVFANGLATTSDGQLTGEGVVRVPIKRKGEAVKALRERLGIPLAAVAAVGNSDIDVSMFRQSRIGIAFRPADDLVRAGATQVVADPSLAALRPLLADGA
ncbi:MAG: HAD-IB family phosphatase [Thermoplasmata archaeon]|nr:HAD-IB family phosphatase [Thermoplasmata archaeon]